MSYYEQVKNGGLVVDLDSENLGDEGAQKLAQALKNSKSKVQDLRLCGNDIGDDGAIKVICHVVN